MHCPICGDELFEALEPAGSRELLTCMVCGRRWLRDGAVFGYLTSRDDEISLSRSSVGGFDDDRGLPGGGPD